MKTISHFFILFIFMLFMIHSVLYLQPENNNTKENGNTLLKLDKNTIAGDVTSYYLNSTTIRIGDGKIDDFWKDVPQNPIIEWSTTTQEGWMKTVYDDFYIYVLISHSYDAPWVAVELNATTDPTTSMALNNDGWVFGQGSTGPQGEPAVTWEGDVHFNSNGVHPSQDKRNDLTFEYINNTEAKSIDIEMRRPLITNDVEGCDYPLVKGASFTVKFASGISSETHKNGGTPHIFDLSTNPPPNSNNITNTNTTSIIKFATPSEIKSNNEFLLVTLSSAEMLFNFIILVVIIIFHKRD